MLTGHVHTFKTPGPYCYRINGQVYHVISQMNPESGKPPGFSQIYIFDQQNELENHLKPFSDLNHDTLQELQDMMKEINPYAQAYIHVGDVMKDKPAEDVQLVLQTSQESIDPHRYNLPTGTDVAVIIPTDCGNDITSRDVVVYKSAKDHPEGLSLMNINVKHPMYDPLMYVLIFPYGDKGWEFGMYKSANRKNEQCSPMQYYKYRIMP